MKLFEKCLEIFEKKIFIRNFYINQFNIFLQSDNIIVVQGQRRVGKSFCIIGFLQTIKSTKNEIFYLNKELDTKDEIITHIDLSNIFDDYIKIYGEPKFIIIDEIQDISNWEKFIRAKYAEKKYKIIISGSNSQLLSGELATYLTGRYLNFYIYPFEYQDYLDYQQLSDTKDVFNKYLTYGSLPEIILLDNQDLKKNYLKTTLEAIILKDIVKRYNIKDIVLLEKTLWFLADSIGSLVSLRNIYNYLIVNGYKNISLSTISNYVKYLQNSFIINNVKRYQIKGKKILDQNDKIYFTDLGIRNVFGVDLGFDIGKLIENLVYLKLKKHGYEVYVGQLYDKEIDFIIKKGDIIKYIQVAYLMLHQNTKEREFGNLLSIHDNYEKIVISLDDIAGGNIQGIQWVHLKDFLGKKEI